MGAACCIAARDRTIQHGSSHDILFHRSVRNSPPWSFRWDNRGRVAGEDISLSWLSDGISRNGTVDSKSVTDLSAHSSNTGVAVENDRTGAWCKSVMEDQSSTKSRASASGQSVTTNISLMVEHSELSHVQDPTCEKLSPSVQSTPSLSTSSPISLSQSHQLSSPPIRTQPPRWVCQSPNHQSLSSGLSSPTISDGKHNPTYPSPPTRTESTHGSQGRCSDNWSMQAFSELMSNSLSHHDRRWPSFDSESCKTVQSNSRSVSSPTPSINRQTCGVCMKLLIEKSAWNCQRIMGFNDLSVVAVLTCGHVYHAECLERVTPENDKFDPACPLCTFGEKKLSKLAGKLVKAAEKDFSKGRRGKGKRQRNRVMDKDDSAKLDYWKSESREGKEPKLSSSSSLKIGSISKPFLRKHFSFSSKGGKSNSESSNPIWKKGLFWAKSSKE